MNYIRQLNAFRERRKIQPLATREIVLWFVLTEYCNELGWMEWFTVAAGVLCGLSGLSATAMKTARSALCAKGYIGYRPGSGNRAGRYLMVDLGAAKTGGAKEEAALQSEACHTGRTLPRTSSYSAHAQFAAVLAAEKVNCSEGAREAALGPAPLCDTPHSLQNGEGAKPGPKPGGSLGGKPGPLNKPKELAGAEGGFAAGACLAAGAEHAGASGAAFAPDSAAGHALKGKEKPFEGGPAGGQREGRQAGQTAGEGPRREAYERDMQSGRQDGRRGRRVLP